MNPVILDVRSAQEYAQGHVQGAINVPTPVPPLDQTAYQQLWNGLYQAVAQVDKNTPIWVYCKKGIRAQVAVDMLQRLKFTQVHNIGGAEQEPLPSMVRNGQLVWVQ
jgi:phage shock protein E